MRKKKGTAEKILASKGTYILLALALCIAGASAYVQKTREQIAEINRESEVYQYPVAAIDEAELEMVENYTPEPEAVATEIPVATPMPVVAQAMGDNVEETPSPTLAPEVMEFMMPAQGEVVLDYSGNELVYSKTLKDWRTHKAIDVAMDKGGFVCAMGNGTVVQSCEDEMMGYTVIIDHGNDIISIYCGLDGETALKAGDTVRMGDLIAQLGEPGASESAQKYHLHFALKKNCEYINPQDLFTEIE